MASASWGWIRTTPWQEMSRLALNNQSSWNEKGTALEPSISSGLFYAPQMCERVMVLWRDSRPTSSWGLSRHSALWAAMISSPQLS